MQVLLFTSCLTETFYPRSLIAMVRVLEHLGCSVSVPPNQTCCGQPMYNNGFTADAAEIACRFVMAFAGEAPIVTPSASCAAMLREHYVELLTSAGHDVASVSTFCNRVREFGEFLSIELHVDLAATAILKTAHAESPTGLPITCHESCHSRSLGKHGATAQQLQPMCGKDFVPLDKWDQCCGFGGTFAVKYPLISDALVRDKVDAIRATGANVVVCSDSGCRLNIEGAARRGGLSVTFVSLAELLAERWGLT